MAQMEPKERGREKGVTETPVIDNIFRLEGRAPLGKAIPFGLQHILAMFVANRVPDEHLSSSPGTLCFKTLSLVRM